MSVVTLTALEFSTILPARVMADSTMSSNYTLNLIGKFGAILHCFIGRLVITQLQRPGYIAIRPTQNDSISTPVQSFDFVSNIYACSKTTQNGAHSSSQITLSSATGFTYMDTCCRVPTGYSTNTDLALVEFFRVARFSGAVLYPDQDFRLSGSNGDHVSNQADVGRIWLPGGEKYNIRAVNPSAYELCFKVDAQVFASETIT